MEIKLCLVVWKLEKHSSNLNIKLKRRIRTFWAGGCLPQFLICAFPTGGRRFLSRRMSSDRVDKADKGAKIITVSCWGGPFKEQPRYHFTSFTRFEIWILFEATDNRQYGASRTLCFYVRLWVTIANLTWQYSFFERSCQKTVFSRSQLELKIPVVRYGWV